MNGTNGRTLLLALGVFGICVSFGHAEIRTPSTEQQRANSASRPDTFGIGRPATADEIAKLNIDVMPNGDGLPPGGGTATDGAQTWEIFCSGCHGTNGEGGTAAPLVGRDPNEGPLTVGNFWPYATTLYDYINRAMPQTAPGTLSPDQVYGLVAWILTKNEIIAADAIIDARTLPTVTMPAHDRFVTDNRQGGPIVR